MLQEGAGHCRAHTFGKVQDWGGVGIRSEQPTEDRVYAGCVHVPGKDPRVAEAFWGHSGL